MAPNPYRKLQDSQLDAELVFLCSSLDQLEALRIAQTNQLKAAKNLGVVDPSAQLIEEVLLPPLQEAEKNLVSVIEKASTVHSFLPLVTSASKGLGDKTIPRLVTAIGSPPNWNLAACRPRWGVDELYTYAGLNVVNGQAPRRVKGVKGQWNPKVRTRAYIAADTCLKQTCSACRRHRHDVKEALIAEGKYKRNDVFPYIPPPDDCFCEEDNPLRSLYDRERLVRSADIHTHPCPLCSPSNQPDAAPGTPLSVGHVHKRAMRTVMKSIIQIIWDLSVTHYTEVYDLTWVNQQRKERTEAEAAQAAEDPGYTPMHFPPLTQEELDHWTPSEVISARSTS